MIWPTTYQPPHTLQDMLSSMQQFGHITYYTAHVLKAVHLHVNVNVYVY